MQHISLVSGQKMPMLGLGTWRLRGEGCKQTVKDALASGYTHIDTAWKYENQRAIGDGLKEAGVDRAGLFITSKVWRTHLHYEGVLAQCEETLRDLQTPYVDLFLIHWPDEATPMAETFRGLNRLLEEGKARNIGVSNFSVAHMEEARSVSQAPIGVNQIKYHPGEEKPDVLRWCKAHDVAVTAYSPLGKGRILQEAGLVEIADRHGKTPAQVALRWLVQQGIVVIPKASSGAHLKENMDVFDWSLSAEEMEQIGRLGEQMREINTFEDFVNLTDREIQLVLREVDTKDLALALKGGSGRLKDRIFSNLSARVGTMIEEEMASCGPVERRDVEDVQARMVQIAREEMRKSIT